MPGPRNVHFENLLDNLDEVHGLSRIHTQITGTGPGRRHNVQVLHKGSIVLLVAMWEAYVEDLASGGLEFLLDKANRHDVLPKIVRDRIAQKLTTANAWELAGDGWRAQCRNNLKEVLAKTTGSLNTPKTEQVDELFDKVLGLKSISQQWRWGGRTRSRAVKAVDELVTLRGSIAHRVQAARSVTKKDVDEARELILRCALQSHNAVTAHLTGLTGEAPWSHVK